MNNNRSGFSLILPLTTLAALGLLWDQNNHPMPENPQWIIISLILLAIFYFFQPKIKRFSWTIPNISNNLNWINSGRRFIWLTARGALPAAILAISFSLAHFFLQHKELRRDYDLMMVYDYSGSMYGQATESQSRAQVAQQIALQLVSNSKAGNIGLVGFAQKAVLLAPLTTETDVIGNILTRTPPDLGDGTAIGDALMVALAHLSKSKAKHKTILIISDGINNSGLIALEEASKIARDLKIPLEGLLIGASYRIHDTPPVSRASLEQLALGTGGRFWNQDQVEDLVNLGSDAPFVLAENAKRPIDYSSALAVILLFITLFARLGPWRARHG